MIAVEDRERGEKDEVIEIVSPSPHQDRQDCVMEFVSRV